MSRVPASTSLVARATRRAMNGSDLSFYAGERQKPGPEGVVAVDEEFTDARIQIL
jgi:hypothetical protein